MASQKNTPTKNKQDSFTVEKIASYNGTQATKQSGNDKQQVDQNQKLLNVFSWASENALQIINLIILAFGGVFYYFAIDRVRLSFEEDKNSREKYESAYLTMKVLSDIRPKVLVSYTERPNLHKHSKQIGFNTKEQWLVSSLFYRSGFLWNNR